MSISEGYFRLENIVGSDGTVLLQFDVDHDGAPDRQRRISLAEIGAGYGKHIALGQVVLGRNAAALRLLQYVRDEAHRFAQHYHHVLRRKKLDE